MDAWIKDFSSAWIPDTLMVCVYAGGHHSTMVGVLMGVPGWTTGRVRHEDTRQAQAQGNSAHHWPKLCSIAIRLPMHSGRKPLHKWYRFHVNCVGHLQAPLSHSHNAAQRPPT